MSDFGPLISRRVALATLVVIAVAGVLLLDGNSSPASAQVDCADADGYYQVATAAELNAAIVCINTDPAVGPDGFPAAHQIDLLDDIEASTIAGGAVFEPLVFFGDLSIEGNGFSLSRSPDAPDDPLPLLSLFVDGETNLFEIGLRLSLDETSAIEFAGSELRLWGSSIQAPSGSTATGLVVAPDGIQVGLRGSSIEGVAIGIDSKSYVSVDDSTIHSTDTDLVAPDDDFAVVGNSTLAGPIGIQMSDNTVFVENSTVLGDGAVPGGPDAAVLYRSSIVASCTAQVLLAAGNPEPPDPPIPAVIDFGTNAGGCFDADHVIDTELGDNGCEVPTPAGCPTTVALRSDSPAIGVGDCGDAFTDQRHRPRTPVGAGCDAGSVEFDPILAACIEADGSFSVATAAELNAAIGCYNAAQPGSVDFEITLAADIEANTVGTTAVFTPIASETDAQFVVEGQGFTLRRGTPAPTTPLPLIQLQPDLPAPFGLFDVALEVGANDTAAVEGTGPVSVALIRSAITASSPPAGSAGFRLDGDAAELVAFDSLIDGVAVGIQMRGASLELYDSTVASTQIDLDVELPDPAAGPMGTVENSTLAGPVGVRLAAGWFEVSHATIIGDGAVSGGDPASSIISFRSSVVGSCSLPVFPPDSPPPSGQFVLEFEGNVGGCFDPGDQIDTDLADNGCARATPIGCPRTVRLSPNAAARDAGDCSAGRDTDQRGEPRTPLGPGCDAGSYELSAIERCDTTPIEVSSGRELNDALRCFNDYDPGVGQFLRIELMNDITAEAVTDNAVFAEIDGAFYIDLAIDGNGHTIGRGPDAGTTALPVLAHAGPGGGSLTITDLGIELTPDDTAGIHARSNVRFDAERLAIMGTSGGGDHVGLLFESSDVPNGSEVFIRDSLIDGVRVGVETTASEFFVTGSTIGSTDTDVRVEAGTFASVTNSTLTGPIGLRGVDNVFLVLAYSTVTGDGAAFPAGRPGFVRAYSNIIGSCSASVDEAADPDVGIIVDFDGNNVGGCFVDGQSMDTLAADNGCETPTPSGCPKTIALSPDAPALGAGFCGETDGGQILTDQRGEPRTPLAQGCDAGAFESPGYDPTADLGDVDNDGDVDNADVQALLDYLARGDVPEALNAGDVTGDGSLELDDALALAQQVAG